MEKKKDTVKTEVVEVVSTYNPKIADAKKIKKNPVIELLKNSEKKKLNYTIFSAPVASTFTPKSGVVKGIDVGVKERVYMNYLAAGFGNYTSPYFEAFLHHATRFENEFGLYAKYVASLDNIKNTALNSNFSNLNIGAFYKQEERYFDWKVNLNTEFNSYNWYGLPNLNFTETTVNNINPGQKYAAFTLGGEVSFIDSYIEFGKLGMTYFKDDFNSTETLVDVSSKLKFPMAFLSLGLNDVDLKAGLEYLKGEFKNDYDHLAKLKYGIFTANIQPTYKFSIGSFNAKAGFKTFLSLDAENDVSKLLLFPDLHLETPIVVNYLTAYGGFTGDLHTNTYKSFTEENPFVSPNLFITQTAETSNLFVGLKGKVTNDISFNLKVSAKNEEDKALFLRNNSKSDGTTTIKDSRELLGYEYGNSFGVYYDDVKTTSFFAEAEYDFSKRLTFGSQITYDNYNVKNATEAWNLPALQASISGKYKALKWFATSNIFYVSERKDASYAAEYPASFTGSETINSFVDINLNGGYHFSDKFSAFLKLNNILNSNYQRFANFNTQGFQILGGLTYKFDF
ncbi:hypothetical protein [Polaribacter sp.]|uniref:hypothetical protein n=1 Tax=Polaribacter sp. TaxID=1920175 RepID=UPI003EF2B623